MYGIDSGRKFKLSGFNFEIGARAFGYKLRCRLLGLGEKIRSLMRGIEGKGFEVKYKLRRGNN